MGPHNLFDTEPSVPGDVFEEARMRPVSTGPGFTE